MQDRKNALKAQGCQVQLKMSADKTETEYVVIYMIIVLFVFIQIVMSDKSVYLNETFWANKTEAKFKLYLT